MTININNNFFFFFYPFGIKLYIASEPNNILLLNTTWLLYSLKKKPINLTKLDYHKSFCMSPYTHPTFIFCLIVMQINLSIWGRLCHHLSKRLKAYTALLLVDRKAYTATCKRWCILDERKLTPKKEKWFILHKENSTKFITNSM